MEQAATTIQQITESLKQVVLAEKITLEHLLVQIGNPSDQNYVRAVQKINQCTGKVVVTGVGKSGQIAKKIAATFASTGTRSVFMHPSEGLHGDLGMIDSNDIVLALGKSGESAEVLQLLPAIRKIGAKVFAITAKPESSLARNSDLVLFTPVEREACPLDLAPTASTTAALAVGDALALTLMKLRGFKADDFALFHPGGALGKRLSLLVNHIMVPVTQVPVLDLTKATINSVMQALSDGGLGVVLFTETLTVTTSNTVPKLAGIFTDGDLRRLLLKHQSALLEEPLRSNAKKWVNTKPTTVGPNVLAHDALAIMEQRERPLNILPVTDQAGHALGVLRLHELLKG